MLEEMISGADPPIRPQADDEELAVARANNMNVDEGHLGGYIRASSSPAPSGLRVDHGDPLTYTPDLWQWFVEELGVGSVLDVGCGEGIAAAHFRSLGCDVSGIDGSEQARRDSRIPDAHVVHDFTAGPFLSATEVDLVWCCEFVEHVEEQYSSSFLELFGASRQYLAMTYAAPGQPGWHHVNCQPAGYWIDRIERLGFAYHESLTESARDHAGHSHFGVRGLVFERR